MEAVSQATAGISRRTAALAGGIGLLVIALLAPFAYIFVLQHVIVVAGDATATANNILESEGLFRASIAAFLLVIMLDVLVAWALYAVLKPVNSSLSMLVAWLRLVFAAAFAVALANLFDALQLLHGSGDVALRPDQLHAQVMLSVSSFQNGWDIALAIFGLHLLGLGVLLYRSGAFPKFLGVLVMVAGFGYLVDTFAAILVPGYDFSVAEFAFVGEALLIFWLFWRGFKGFPSDVLRAAPEQGAIRT